MRLRIMREGGGAGRAAQSWERKGQVRTRDIRGLYRLSVFSHREGGHLVKAGVMGMMKSVNNLADLTWEGEAGRLGQMVAFQVRGVCALDRLWAVGVKGRKDSPCLIQFRQQAIIRSLLNAPVRGVEIQMCKTWALFTGSP
jgi:hypothetical protein